MKQKKFNITGICVPGLHYMVDTGDKIEEIVADYIVSGEYFTINRARQYGKSTTLELLYNRLKGEYLVLDISFEGAEDCFASVYTLAQGIVNKAARALAANEGVSDALMELWRQPIPKELPLDALGEKITRFCQMSEKEVILMVDEVDKAADNQVFLNFLGLLREKYLRRSVGRDDTFKSVILAGVYDVKNLRMKLRPGKEAHYNSPWNIAAEFQVDMSFSVWDIEKMLCTYEQDRHTGMDIADMAGQIFAYTSGYPFLVSFLCKCMDEGKGASAWKEEGLQLAVKEGEPAWTRESLQEAVKAVVRGPNTLYDDMVKQVAEHPQLSRMLQNILFRGVEYPYHEYSEWMNIGKMLGFIRDKNRVAAVSNRIFEMQLYSYFLSEELFEEKPLSEDIPDRNQFIRHGNLDMDLVMRKFYEYYTALYQKEDGKFLEEYGRKIFLLYLKPIINGSGNFYVEAETRDKTRTDVVIDYRGRQYIVELKIWRGAKYHAEGEEQLAGYLEQYHLQRGYLLSFSFARNRGKTGIREAACRGKSILEVVV